MFPSPPVKKVALKHTSSLKFWPLLRERSFGIMEGKTIGEFKELAIAAGLQDNPFSYTPEGGETIDNIRIRAGNFFKVMLACHCCELFLKSYILQELKDDLNKSEIVRSNSASDCDLMVLVVSHGRFLKELMLHLHSAEG